MTKKKPKFGALPTLNMPKKSHDSRKPVPRPPRSIVRDHEDKTNKQIYKSFEDFCVRVKSLKTLCTRKLEQLHVNDRMLIKRLSDSFLFPETQTNNQRQSGVWWPRTANKKFAYFCGINFSFTEKSIKTNIKHEVN